MTSVSQPSRLYALDGLRGIAALIVVIHHALLTQGAFADAFRFGGTSGGDPLVWGLTFTPIHAIWAGSEAVTVFFVLSGFVLTGPFISPPRPSLAAYYPSRLLRLYLPVWASLVIALVTATVFYPTARQPDSWWMAMHSGVDPMHALVDGLLVFGASPLNSPLWSLQWEIIFSLALPLYVVLARLMRGPGKFLLGVSLSAVVIGAGIALNIAALTYLPVFFLGSLLAANQQQLRKLVLRVRNGMGWLIFSVAVVMLVSEWFIRDTEHPSVVAVGTLRMLGVLGAVSLVAISAFHPAVGATLSRATVRWLGARSFSLYLVHEPLIVATGFATEGAPLAVSLAVILTLPLAEVFYRTIERPSHRLARLVGTRISASAGS